MDELTAASTFLLGLAGAGHCVGMCGPLVVAIPGRANLFSAHIWYHTGRTTTYCAVGIFMGSIGVGLTDLAGRVGADPALWMSKIQVSLSLLSATFLFWFGISQIGLINEPTWLSAAAPDRVPGYKRALKWAIVDKKSAGMFFIGLMMGFLPCGLSYAAFARALSSSGPVQGGLLLLSFAMGTIPGLLLIGAGASGFFKKYRKYSDLISGLLMIGMGFSLAADAFFAFA